MYGKDKKSKGGKGLTAGLKNHSPEACDKSTQMQKSPTLEAGALRKKTAPTPKSLGPRTA